MRKTAIVAMAVGLLAASLAPAFALLRSDFTAVEGAVVSKAEGKVTIKNEGTGAHETFTGDAGQLAPVNKGDKVLILHQIGNPSIGTIIVTQPSK